MCGTYVCSGVHACRGQRRFQEFSPSAVILEIKFTSSDLFRKVPSSWPERLLRGVKFKIQHFGCSKKISYIFSKTSICIKEKLKYHLSYNVWRQCIFYYNLKIRHILFVFVPLGAYLLPYLILLLVIGIPLFFLELSVGQRIRRGSIGVWNYISPKLGGIGFASCVVSLLPRHCSSLCWFEIM